MTEQLSVAEKLILCELPLSEGAKKVYYLLLKTVGPLAEVTIYPNQFSAILLLSERTVWEALGVLASHNLITKISSPSGGRGRHLLVRVEDPKKNRLLKDAEKQSPLNRLSHKKFLS